MIKRLLIIVLCLCSMASLDAKVYSPSFCTPTVIAWTYPATGSQIPTRWIGGSFGAEIGSAGTGTSVTVHCPLIRDDVSNTTGVSALTVYVYDNDAAGQVTCTARSFSADGTQTFAVGPLSTGVSFTSGIALTPLSFGSGLNVGYNGGTYDVICAITGAGSIGGLTFTEPGGGDTL